MSKPSPLFIIFLLLLVAAAAEAQAGPPGAPAGAQQPAYQGNSQNGTMMASPIAAGQQSFTGSIPQGKPTGAVLQLGFLQALDMGLRNNLGLVTSSYQTEAARAERLRALADLLPNVNGFTQFTSEQVNLAAFGISVPGIPQIIGPFHLFDARAYFAETIDLHRLGTYRSNAELEHASRLGLQNAREMVVLVVGELYLAAIADAARVDTAQAQLNTATALYNQASDMKTAGTRAGIDVLRAQVEMQAEQQRLLAVKNELEKAKLRLARAIGLPEGQAFLASEEMPFRAAPAITLEDALERAYRTRSDYRAVQSLAEAAARARHAAEQERLPGIEVDANYGDLGTSPTSSHGTYTASAGLRIPIFQGGRVRADIEAAEALERQRKAEADNMRAQVEFDVRTAMLDLESAAQQVTVATQAVKLANDALQQSEDRFKAGVTDGVEVVQAQQQLATAEENYIASLNSHNVAKLLLAHSVGDVEQQVRAYLKGTP